MLHIIGHKDFTGDKQNEASFQPYSFSLHMGDLLCNATKLPGRSGTTKLIISRS